MFYCISHFIFAIKLFEGLNAGKSCASMTKVVFFEMLRAVFLARCFTMKLPKPRRNTSSFLPARLCLTSSMKASMAAVTSFRAIPVSSTILLMISAFVISLYFCCDNLLSLNNSDCKYTDFQRPTETYFSFFSKKGHFDLQSLTMNNVVMHYTLYYNSATTSPTPHLASPDVKQFVKKELSSRDRVSTSCCVQRHDKRRPT